MTRTAMPIKKYEPFESEQDKEACQHCEVVRVQDLKKYLNYLENDLLHPEDSYGEWYIDALNHIRAELNV